MTSAADRQHRLYPFRHLTANTMPTTTARHCARCLAALLGLTLAAASASAAPVLTLGVFGGAITVGDNLSVELRISGVSDLYGWEVDLRFDPALISLSSQSAGNFFDTAGPSLFVPGVLDSGTGVISFVAGSLFGSVAGVDNDGVLARFSFNTSASGPATFSLSNATLIDSQLSSISGVTLRGLTVDIQQPVGGGQPVSLPGTLALALPPLVWLVRSRRVAAVSG